LLETVQFIAEHGLAALSDRFKILVRRHAEFPSLVHLSYNQIESPMGERVCQECRGLILDEADSWRVVSCPFFKFFNYGNRTPHRSTGPPRACRRSSTAR